MSDIDEVLRQLPAEVRGRIEHFKVDGLCWHVIFKHAGDYERVAEPVRRAVQEIDRKALVTFGSRTDAISPW
jgi:hypothetical protein